MTNTIKKKKNLIFNIILVMPAILIGVAVLVRLFYGTELTDEAFYVAMSKSFTDGMIPFATNWDIAQTSAFFLVPFLFIYKLIVGNTEGIFLFTRIIFFIFILGISSIGYFAIKKYINKFAALYISLILVTYAPFSLYNASYNSLCYSFLILGLFLLLNAFSINDEEKQKKKKTLFFLAGIAHALMAFVYPTMVLVAVFIGLIIVPKVIHMYSNDFKKVIQYAKYYAFGGTLSAIILGVILLILVGGIGNLLIAVKGISSNPYYSSSGINIKIISEALSYIINAIKLQHLELGIYIIFISFFCLKKLKEKFPLSYIMLLFLPFFAFVYEWKFVRTDTLTQILYAFLTGGILPVGLLMLTKQYKQLFTRLFVLIYAPTFFAFLVICNSSAGTYKQAPWIMIPGMILSAIFISILIKEQYEIYIENKKTHKFDKLLKTDTLLKTIQIVTCLLFCFGNLYSFYRIVYRDDKIQKLNYTVESGVYKGIRTTETRKNLLEETEKYIKSIDKKDAKFMAMDNVPYVYLMSDMQPSVPSLWAPTLYRIGLKDCSQIMFYYNNENSIPDYIYYFQVKKYGILNDPDYQLYDFIKENYICINDSENVPNVERFLVYERK